MRDLAFIAVLLPLLGVATVRPFVGIMLWSWISFMNPHRLLYGAAATMPWAMMVFLATLIGCVVAREPKKPAINAVTVLLMVFAVGITLTSVTALGAPDAVWPKWEHIIKVIIGLQLTAALLTDARRIHALIWLMVVSVGYFGVKGGAFTALTGGGFVVNGPPDTMIGDRNHLAAALLVTLPLLNYLRLRSDHAMVRMGLIAAMGLMLLSSLGTQSRGALVALVATAGVLWLRSSGKIVSGIAIVLAIALTIAFMPQTWVDRMNTIGEFQTDESAMGRVLIWQASFKLGLMRPLVGAGFKGMYSQSIIDSVQPGTPARAAHSIWFEVIGEHGFVVFAIWLAILGAGALYTLRMTRLAKGREDLAWVRDLARMSQVAMVSYAAGGSFLSLAYWDFFWTLMVVLAASYRLAVAQVAGAPGAGEAAVAARRWGTRVAAPGATQGAPVPAGGLGRSWR